MARAPASKFQRGDRVGRFRLVDTLGEGSMGRVWRVEGPSGPAALKILSHEVAGGRERFEREARALLKLRHDNVVRAIDYGHTDDGTPFMALELLEGDNLEDILFEREVLDPEDAVRIVLEAAEGLAAAHRLGMVHRDVKPGNIFVCDDGTVKVLDFGIAFWDPSDGRLPVSRLTAPGSVMGTPSYMAPEQASGSIEAGERTDVWGLGAVLYHLVVGREPFGAGGNYLAELARILTEDPDPMPTSIPAPIRHAVMGALEKDEARRTTSMDRFVATLRAEGAPVRRESRIDVQVMGALADEVRLVSAALVEGIGADDHDAFLEAVRDHGGIGSPMRGRRAVAVFGGDAWIGDETERAVQLGLDVRGFVSRVAVGTGKALRQIDQRSVVTGQAVGAAEKAMRSMESDAQTIRPPGLGGAGALTARSIPAPILVCPDSQRRLRGGFKLVGARVIGRREGAEMLRPREVGGHEIPFVGREDELRLLTSLVDDAETRDRARMAVILGAPGVGKSRLRFELMRWLVEQELEEVQLEGRGESGRAFGVVAQMLRRRARLPEGRAHEEARRRIEELVESAHLRGETATGTRDFLGELLGVPFDENPPLLAARSDPRLMADRIRMAVSDLVGGWLSHDLVVITVEDAHQADDASLDLLDRLLGRHEHRPLVILATARPTFFVERDALAEALRVQLRELRDDAIGSIVAAALGHPEPAIVERAGGNPYLAEELSLAVREGADPGALPLTVEGAVLARLDKLSPDEKDVLKRAAVIGRRFWREAVEALGEPEAERLLGQLRRRDLVERRDTSQLDGCEEWTFRQAIVFEVCRGLLTEEQRRALNKAAASWLSHRLDAAPAEIAEFFERAGDESLAVLWWLRAVHAAQRRGDGTTTARHAERALSISSNLPVAETFALRLLRCEAWYWLGDRDALESELHKAENLAQLNPSLGASAQAQMEYWRALHLARDGKLGQALHAIAEAVRLGDEGAGLDLQVQLRATQAGLLTARGKLDAALAAAEDALGRATRQSGATMRAVAARARAQAEAQRGAISASLFYFSMARNLCKEVGALREATLAGIGVGAGLHAAGDFEQAHRVLEKTLVSAESLGLGDVIGWTKRHLAATVQRRGDVTEARALADDALERARRHRDRHLEIAAMGLCADLDRHAGQPALALTLVDEALERCLQHGVRLEEPVLRMLRTQLLVDLGRHEEALVEYTHAARSRDAAGGMLPSEVPLLVARRDAFAALGQDEDADIALRAARMCFEARMSTIDEPALEESFTRLHQGLLD